MRFSGSSRRETACRSNFYGRELNEMGKGQVLTKKIGDLVPDDRNANKGTERGQQMIENSLRTFGAGRSILLDKNGKIIAGNKTVENAGAIGLEDVLVVQTNGNRLVAVQRMDLDLDRDERATRG